MIIPHFFCLWWFKLSNPRKKSKITTCKQKSLDPTWWDISDNTFFFHLEPLCRTVFSPINPRASYVLKQNTLCSGARSLLANHLSKATRYSSYTDTLFYEPLFSSSLDQALCPLRHLDIPVRPVRETDLRARGDLMAPSLSYAIMTHFRVRACVRASTEIGIPASS